MSDELEQTEEERQAAVDEEAAALVQSAHAEQAETPILRLLRKLQHDVGEVTSTDLEQAHAEYAALGGKQPRQPSQQWRQAAGVLRTHAAKFDEIAARYERNGE